MGCEPFYFGDGGVAILCGGRRGPKIERCIGCGKVSDLLCDGPGQAGRKSCDAPICGGCAKSTGKNRDLCPGCAIPVTASVREDHPRRAEWEKTFGTAPVPLVSAEPKSGQYRIHIHQLRAEVYSRTADHYARKLNQAAWVVRKGLFTGQVKPVVSEDMLTVNVQQIA